MSLSICYKVGFVVVVVVVVVVVDVVVIVMRALRVVDKLTSHIFSKSHLTLIYLQMYVVLSVSS